MEKTGASFSGTTIIKIVSILLALLLELYFYSPKNSVSATIPFSVEFRNLPHGLMIVEPLRAERGISAQLEVRGPGPLVQQVQNSIHKIFINLPPEIGANYTAVIEQEQLRIPAGVEILSVRPAAITIRTEQVASKELRVDANITGQVRANYELEKVKISPETVVVHGPRSKLEGVLTIKTSELDVTDLTSSVHREVIIESLGPSITFGVNMVGVDIQIAPKQGEREFADISLSVRGADGMAATVEPTKVRLVLKGLEEVLSELPREQIKAFADASKLEPGINSVSPEVELPAGVKLLKVFPEKVKVQVVKKKQ